MTTKAFIDTNIFLYRVLQNPKDDPIELARKQAIATEITNSQNLTISTQVINETSANLIKKGKFKEEAVRQFINALYRRYQIAQLDSATFLRASHLRQNYSFSYWDSLIVASALEAKAEILYSEDMQHELIVDNQIQIINPFQ
ncbi:PIN domain-containing protein [[Limnothrix rosea] IAM M-220]|uniref:PIN domain-containing protein n=1 Tax=[Limnothrix rosea] IAM M-220 TaxID=454133 RepID=UPI0009691157|nr:PIN domain-containing protein [[Limnothrix rosea] IAM M-220]OKH17506.1 twitching motility protein PilT [[Limnothrix rosea] IAM M-220]